MDGALSMWHSLVPHLAFIVFDWLAGRSSLSEGFLSMQMLWWLYLGREKQLHDPSQAKRALISRH